jgi:hypothetical protein
MKTFTQLLAAAKQGEWTEEEIRALNAKRVPKSEEKSVNDAAFRISDKCAQQVYKALCGGIVAGEGVGKIKGIGRVIVMPGGSAKTETGRIITIGESIVEYTDKDFVPLYDRGIQPGCELLTNLLLAIQHSSIEDRLRLYTAMYPDHVAMNTAYSYGAMQHIGLIVEATDDRGGSSYKGKGPLMMTARQNRLYLLNRTSKETGNEFSWEPRADGSYGVRILSDDEVREVAKLQTVADFWTGVKLG